MGIGGERDKKTEEDEGEDEWVPMSWYIMAWWALEAKVPVIS